jgi:hypothetical protein
LPDATSDASKDDDADDETEESEVEESINSNDTALPPAGNVQKAAKPALRGKMHEIASE